MADVLLVSVSFMISMAGAAYMAKFGLHLDIPNARSSHKAPIPRGGGIGIWGAFIVVTLAETILFDFRPVFFSLVLILSGVLGLMEDRLELSSWIRLILQFLLSAFIISSVSGLPLSGSEWWIFLFLVIFITGTTNFYNFMDGINGMAGLTGVVAFGLSAGFSLIVLKEADYSFIGIVLAAGCAGFLPLNFPVARVFMGDVGSIFLGFSFASIITGLSSSVSIFLCMAMFLCMFYSDAVVTMYYRWRQGEGLTKPHRRHLYQYLSNELGLPHWKVSMLYAVIQLVLGGVSILAYMAGLIYQISLIIIFSLLFILCYRYVRSFSPVVLKN